MSISEMAATAKLTFEKLLSENVLDFCSNNSSDNEVALPLSFEPSVFKEWTRNHLME